MVTVTIHVCFRSEIVTFIDLKTRLEASVEQLGIIGYLSQAEEQKEGASKPSVWHAAIKLFLLESLQWKHQCVYVWNFWKSWHSPLKTLLKVLNRLLSWQVSSDCVSLTLSLPAVLCFPISSSGGAELALELLCAVSWEPYAIYLRFLFPWKGWVVLDACQ